ncbi:MAG: C39 family peptidase [Thermoanaerobacteraceae bacterium]|nr:C39 family peptidase [Thermoanaerobacteraceae bacterium]
MKRNCIIVLSILLTLVLTTTAFANSTVQIDKDGPNIYGEYYSEGGGQVGIEVLLNESVDVPSFSQNDPRWADDHLNGCESTIGKAGCAVTSVAMVVKYFGVDTDPGQVNKDLGTDACPLNWWAVPSKAANDTIELDTVVHHPTYEEFYNTAVRALSEDKPVILGFHTNAPCNDLHFVVVKRVYGDGIGMSDYTAIDPLDGQAKDLGNILDGRSLHKMIVYK